MPQDDSAYWVESKGYCVLQARSAKADVEFRQLFFPRGAIDEKYSELAKGIAFYQELSDYRPLCRASRNWYGLVLRHME